MDYLKKTFTVPLTSKAYADNWDAVFRNDKAQDESSMAREGSDSQKKKTPRKTQAKRVKR